MTPPVLEDTIYPSLEELRDIGLRALAFRAAQYDLEVNVLPGSEYHFCFTALASMIVPAFANNKIAVKALNPIDAVGDPLREMATVHGVPERTAAPSTGRVLVEVTGGGTVPIPANFFGTAKNGTQIKTTGPATVGDGDPVDVVSVKGGSATQLAPNSPITWDSAAIANLKQTAKVDSSGLTGGTDDDTEEDTRGRLLDRLSSPANGGNWSFVRNIARDASATVDAAFVYSLTPGVTAVCVVKNTGDRQVTQAVVNQVTAALVARVPGRTKWNVTRATAEYLDMILSAALPLPLHAGGSGGGWLDATPFPSASNGPVKITATNVATSTLTLNISAVPSNLVAGTHIGVYDWEDEKVYHYVIASATDMGATVDVVIATPGVVKNHTGAYVSADCENLDSYCAEFLEAMREQIGPGEKTSSAAFLPKAARKPAADVEMPADITSRLLPILTDNHAELISATFTATYQTGTTTPQTSPTVPAALTDPPNILALKHLAFIKA